MIRMKSIWHRMSKCLPGKFEENDGVSAVIVAVVIVVLVGFAALAIDIGHLAVVRNELQNAADAGALNGARVLYPVDEAGELIIPVTVNTDANAEARTAAIANNSDKSAVEVNLGTGNNADVRRGNWNQDTNVFTESTGANEDDPDFVNAMRVTTNRISAISFLASIFGISSFTSQASAIAYRGYAGTNVVFDQPIAICMDQIVDASNNFVCTTGRMFNNGGEGPTSETSRWTNFAEGCEPSANTGNILDVVCKSSPPTSLGSVSTNNGAITPVMTAVRECWADATGMTEPWEITLPVVECVNPPTCSQIVGAVTVKVVWMTDNGADPGFNNIPVAMEGWDGWNTGREGLCPGDGWSAATNCAGLTNEACWNNFVYCFDLKYLDSNGIPQPVPKVASSLYFVPSCEFVAGGPGGADFGVISKIPKLVQ